MKITKQHLNKLIREAVKKTLKENYEQATRHQVEQEADQLESSVTDRFLEGENPVVLSLPYVEEGGNFKLLIKGEGATMPFSKKQIIMIFNMGSKLIKNRYSSKVDIETGVKRTPDEFIFTVTASENPFEQPDSDDQFGLFQ